MRGATVCLFGVMTGEWGAVGTGRDDVGRKGGLRFEETNGDQEQCGDRGN